jgi:precorrin-6B methylase 2
MIWILLLIIILAFQFVVLFLGAPYVPTLHKQREIALDLLKLKPGQTLIDLGCGDGAMLIEAAKRGIKVVGYEINPLLVFIAWARTRRYSKNVKIIRGNFRQLIFRKSLTKIIKTQTRLIRDRYRLEQ